MANKGRSEQGLFGTVHHYDEHGKKVGRSEPGLFGGYTNYDANGKKIGHSDPGLFGGYNHYDNHGRKTGHSDPGLFGSYTHRDSSGKKTGSSDPGMFGSYHHSDSQGCYVATCVYGSYDCPQVWTLRRFRDNTLAETMLAYYNDQFDLHRGDMVYVDGKLEGMRGRVTEVNYNFKIKVSDYKHVIAVVDTTVSGQFFMAGSHFVTFDRAALPISKAVTWFKAPAKEDDEFVSGSDDTAFRLDDLSGMKVSAAIAERGHEYYIENKVRYICIDGTKGYAIVEGSEGI